MMRPLDLLIILTCASPMLLASDGASGSASNTSAPDPSACIAEIQKVCAGLDSQLETCLDQRGKQLSTPCRDQLQGAMNLASNGYGAGACLPDITRTCNGLGPKDMATCIANNKSTFSQACRDEIDRMESAAQSAKTPHP